MLEIKWCFFGGRSYGWYKNNIQPLQHTGVGCINSTLKTLKNYKFVENKSKK